MFVSACKRIQMITIAWVQFPVHKANVCAGPRDLLPARTCNHMTLHHKQREQKAKRVLKKQHVRKGIAHSTVLCMWLQYRFWPQTSALLTILTGDKLGQLLCFLQLWLTPAKVWEVPPVWLSWQKLVIESVRGHAAETTNNEVDGFGKENSQNRSCQIQQVTPIAHQLWQQVLSPTRVIAERNGHPNKNVTSVPKVDQRKWNLQRVGSSASVHCSRQMLARSLWTTPTTIPKDKNGCKKTTGPSKRLRDIYFCRHEKCW